jgi:hypothetical protein
VWCSDRRGASYIQVATPPWCEQVPRRLFEYEYVPSRHCALAPAGTCPIRDGAGAVRGADIGGSRRDDVGAGAGAGAVAVADVAMPP